MAESVRLDTRGSGLRLTRMARSSSNSPLTRSLDECPVKNGFRQRGCDMTRIETFTDAAFAFAVTLLVVSIDAIPSNYQELVQAMLGAPAFALSFLVLMLFWHGHWEWSRRYGLEDNPTIILSCSLVFVMLCYVYPLKFLFNGMLAFFTNGAIPANVSLNGTTELYAIFAIYGAGFIAMSMIIVLLNLHAWRQREVLELSPLEQFDTRADIAAWSILVGVGVLSVLLALLTPPSGLALPGWIYMLLGIGMPVFGVRMGRKRRALFEDG